MNSDVPGLCAVIRGSLIEHRRLQIGDRGADRESWAVHAKSWIMDRGLCIAGKPGTGGKGIPVIAGRNDQPETGCRGDRASFSA